MSGHPFAQIAELLDRWAQKWEREHAPGGSWPPPVERPAPSPQVDLDVDAKRRITVYISSALYAQARGAILDLGEQGHDPSSISSLLDGALERELRRLAKKHRDGEPWPAHRGRLPGGRPLLAEESER